jgi:hypothetical protein
MFCLARLGFLLRAPQIAASIENAGRHNKLRLAKAVNFFIAFAIKRLASELQQAVLG